MKTHHDKSNHSHHKNHDGLHGPRKPSNGESIRNFCTVNQQYFRNNQRINTDAALDNDDADCSENKNHEGRFSR
ncbi:MAG: hypothetical protein A2W94_07770 [Bacteroidetes bacterium GWE2_42_42]|nr:MAG: hypothetical protein A2W94_07770 [Bacteroidetes bacterium GWE2_42_42]